MSNTFCMAIPKMRIPSPPIRIAPALDLTLGSRLSHYWYKELLMIVIRNVFQLKFGKAREALAVMKEGVAIQKRLVADASARLLTDVTGPHYTLVLELTVPNLATFEAEVPRIFGDKEFQANYQKMVPLVESGHREIFTIVDLGG